MQNETRKVKYGLKINTDFSQKEIEKNTKVIDIDKAEYIEIEDSNLDKLGENFISHIIINLNISGASVNFKGRYKAKDNLVDVSCVVNHKANNTKSNINIKGIAEEEGKIISRSNIFVKENVKDVEGEENAKFIFVIDENGKVGEIDAIPNLDINSHEVKVSHGLTISKMKKSDIWYAGLHSFSQKEAEKDFVESFLN